MSTYIPLQEHPEWGRSIRYSENVIPEDLAAQLLLYASERTSWQEQRNMGRKTASFACPSTKCDVLSYYDGKIEPITTAPAIENCFENYALPLLQSWLPAKVTEGADDTGPLANYVLFNYYTLGSSCARWHQDVPEAIQDWILSISLGSTRTFCLQKKNMKISGAEGVGPVYYIQLPHNCALLMGVGINSTHIHCVPPCDDDEDTTAVVSSDKKSDCLPKQTYTGPRLNLTFRSVTEI
eukprot:PhF_6_TR7318/c0_g1_i2/m.10970